VRHFKCTGSTFFSPKCTKFFRNYLASILLYHKSVKGFIRGGGMTRFLFLLLGIIAFCLIFWTVNQTYFSAADTASLGSDLTRPQSKVEVQAQKIDLKKIDNHHPGQQE